MLIEFEYYGYLTFYYRRSYPNCYWSIDDRI